MTKSGLFRLGAIVALAVLAVAAYRLLATAVEPKIEHRIAGIGLTANEIATNGPLPGDVGLYAKELACAQNLLTPGCYPSINGAEIAGAQRSGMFPCATFTGSFDGPNQVFAWRSAVDDDTASYINNRFPGELYISGRQAPPPKGTMPAGPFIAKADATTGREIWPTYLDNGDVSGAWIANTNLNVLSNGRIVTAWQNKVALLDGDTGLIVKQATLPTGPTPAIDVSYEHLTIAPDGTLMLKDQTRPSGCKLQGTMAIIQCNEPGMKQGNSNLVAVDPNTLDVLDSIALPEPAAVAHIITMFEGRIAIYVGVNRGALCYFRGPQTKKLSQDAGLGG